MFGYHEIPVELARDPISISMRKHGESLLYRREMPTERLERILLGKGGNLAVNPVEPVVKPREITPFLMIEFERSVTVEPKSKTRILLAFPVEIGVFISSTNGYDLLDTLSLVKQKFTLYGDPKNGIICKHWRSGLYSSRPQLDPLRAGVMELVIANNSGVWVEVTKSVFNARAMKVYYKDDLVSASATMKIASPQIAETDFADTALEDGMQKSVGVYSQQRLAIIAGKLVMEWGT
jgi:hypothetical protein